MVSLFGTNSFDYYIDISVNKSLGGKYLEVSTGVFDDGTLTGVKFQNMPGQDGGLKPKKLDETSTLSDIVYYEDYADVTYGAKGSVYKFEDGKLIYKIAESKDAQADAKILFNLGFKIDPYLYNNATSIVRAMDIKIGDYNQAEQKVEPLAGYEQVVHIDDIKQRVASTSAISPNTSVILDEPCPVDEYARIGNTGEAKMIYDKMEYDIYVPDGVTLDDVGFDVKFSKTHNTYGVLEYSEKLTGDEGKSYYHVTMENGMKSTGDIYVYFKNTVLSSHYKVGDKVQVQIKNIFTTLANDEHYAIGDTPVLTLTVIDPGNDPTRLLAYDRTIYNTTIDTDEKYSIQLSKCIVQNDGASETPFDKIFEAEYNVNNSDAVINVITVPLGTNENPEIIITGYDENKNLVTRTVENPRQYVFKTAANTNTSYGQDSYDYGYLLFASDFGLTNIKSVQATIGKLKSLYNYTTPWTTVQYYEYSVGSCYGYFTNENTGIQVVSNYRIYNEVPAYRTKKNGDLFAISTYTSTDVKIFSMTSSSLSVKDLKTGKSYSISNTSSDTAPAIAPGESVRLSSTLLPYSASFSVNETANTPTQVVKGTSVVTVEYLADPVFYITLPNDFRFEDLSFTMGTRRTTYASSTYLGQNKDSVYYGADNWKTTNLDYSIENITYMNPTDDGRNLYKVTFSKDQHAGIGRYDENGNMKRITYTVTIGTSKSSATKRYPLSDLMQISGENPYYGAMYNSGMTSTCYTVYDRYDLNNGHDLSGVTNGAYESGSQWGFSLQKLSDVNSYNFIKATEIDHKPVEQEWHTYTSTDPNSIVLLGAKSKGKYKLVLQNTDNTHATQSLQAVVPIPKKGVDIGEAFMDGPMQYSMDFTWDESDVPDGFTVKYINIEKTSFKDLENSLKYTECGKDKANAILLETSSLEPSRTVEMYFDFVIGDDVEPHDINIFKNSIRYFDFAGNIQTRKGSEVAVEVAVGKISGVAFYDENRNRKFDPGETPLENISVTVVDGLGKFQYVKTDADGKYEFNAVRESDITITFTVDSDSEYRMNIPVSDLTIASNCLSASAKYESLFEETLDIPLDKYITLSYDANPPAGKTATGVLPKTTEHYKNQEVKVATNPDSLKVVNYRFLNWNTKEDGTGTAYSPNETFKIQQDTVLYAQWEKVQLYLTFDYQGGSVATFKKEVLDKTTYSATKKKKILDALNEASVEEGLLRIPYEPGDTIRKTLSLYFLGQPDSGDYQINLFFPMSNDDDSNLSKYGLSTFYYNFLQTTKNGYDALYQNIDGKYLYPCYVRNNSGTTSAVYYNTTFTESKTIYVDWTPKKGYTVKYDTDGGNEIADTTDLSWESNVYNVAKTKVPVKSGYVFSHWEYDGAAVHSAATYGDLAVLDTVESITLKAVYVPKSYTVNYDSKGGSKVSSRVVAFAQANMNSLTAPTKTGFVFEGWSTDGAEENIIAQTTTYSDLVGGNPDTNETTLYAVWKEATGYTVLFNTMGGTAVADKTGLAFSADHLIGDTVTTRQGYKFDKWTVGDKTVTDDSTYAGLVNDDRTVMSVTLIANWTPKIYTIKYTNVVDPVADKTAKWEDSNLLPETDPVRKGYKFSGWTFESADVTQSSTVAGLIPNDDAVDNTLVMTANWEKLKYTVVYDSQGGSYVSPLVDRTVDSANLVPSGVSKEGYELEGWYSESGVKINPSTTIGDIIVGDETTVKLTAKWVAKQGFTVKYNLAGGKSYDGKDYIDDKSVAWTDNNLLPANEPVRSGYKFLNWTYGTKTVDNSTEFGYLAGNEGNNPITLVATWEKLDITIDPKIMGATLYVDNKIGVNFYVYMDGKAVYDAKTGKYHAEDVHYEIAENFSMHFKFKDADGNYIMDGGKVKEEIVNFDRDEINFMNVSGQVLPLFRFTHWCYSFEMADTIEAVMYNGSEAVTGATQYSVMAYGQRMLGKQGADFDNLLKGMLNFGAYSQIYWNYNTGKLANKILAESDKSLAGVNLSKYAYQKSEGIGGITDTIITLGFDKGTGFDLKLTVKTDDEFSLADLSSATIQSDTMVYLRKNKTNNQVKVDTPYDLLPDIRFLTGGVPDIVINRYDLTIANMPVYRWNDFVNIKFVDASGNANSIKLCALSYADEIAKTSSDANLVNLMKAMCLYNEKSSNYFASTKTYENQHGLPEYKMP